MLTLLLVFCAMGNSVNAQDQATGSVQSSTSNRVIVKPHCFNHEMQISVEFNTPTFTDWLALGKIGREECLTHGDGSTRYLLHIQLTNDICGTTMISPGVFENVLTIQTHPHLNLILDTDERIVVRCTYGSPWVKPYIIPQFPSTGARVPFTTVFQREQETTEAPTGHGNAMIVLIVFLVLIAIALCLLCCCVYYFLRRRRLRLERRNKLLLAVPPGSELGMWWPGKPTLSNDALLSHDYMVSSNSTHDPLSVSTGDYVNESPSSGSGSNGSPLDTARSAGSYGAQAFVHETKHMIPRSHAEHASAKASKSLQVIAEENTDSIPSGAIATGLYQSWQREVDKRSPGSEVSRITLSPKESPQYLQAGHKVDQQSKKKRSPVNRLRDIHLGENGSDLPPDRYASEMRSVSEIYTLPTAGRTSSGGLHMPAAHELIHDARPDGEILEVDAAVLSMVPRRIKADIHSGEVDDHHGRPGEFDLDVYIRAVEQQRGQGPKMLSDADVKRWRILLKSDKHLQDLIKNARTVEDFEMLTHHPHYGNMYSEGKWATIVQNLIHVAFLKELTTVIDPANPQQYSVDPDLGLPRLRDRQFDQSYQQTAPNQTSRSYGDLPSEAQAPSRPDMEERIFTRESYAKVKSDIESLSGDESLHENQLARRSLRQSNGCDNANGDGSKVTRDRSTSEIIEKNKTVLRVHEPHPKNATHSPRSHSSKRPRDSPGSKSPKSTPTLSVYMGNIPERSLHESVNMNGLRAKDSFYNAMPSESVTDLS